LRRSPSWPAHEYYQDYDGHTFLLLPETETTDRAISIEEIPPLTDLQANAAVRRFLSALAWATDAPIEISFGIGKHAPGGIGKDKGPVRSADPRFYIDYLPAPASDKARLCLALYREALGLETNNDAYAFLGFYKIINALFDKGPAQKKWINREVGNLTDYRVKERLGELAKTEKDIGEYLYVSGRCAIAHAFGYPIADPDSPADSIRLRQDLVVMKALARQLMEIELGIQKPETHRKLHLYELAGFRELLGPALVARLKAKEPVKQEEIPPLPKVSMQIRHHLARGTFQNMTVRIAGLENGMLALECIASSGLAAVVLELDFVDEKLFLNALEHIYVNDDGSLGGIVAAYDCNILETEIFMNGILEVWNAETGDSLGRSAPFRPVNMRYDHKAAQSQMKRLRTELIIRGARRPKPKRAVVERDP
jgi:hypothetical protein